MKSWQFNVHFSHFTIGILVLQYAPLENPNIHSSFCTNMFYQRSHKEVGRLQNVHPVKSTSVIGGCCSASYHGNRHCPLSARQINALPYMYFSLSPACFLTVYRTRRQQATTCVYTCTSVGFTFHHIDSYHQRIRKVVTGQITFLMSYN